MRRLGYFNGSPRTQCAGAGVVTKPNGPSLSVARPQKIRLSYVLMNVISTVLKSSAASTPSSLSNPRNGQAYEPWPSGSNLFFPVARCTAIPGPMATAAPPGPSTGPWNWQAICKLENPKSALLFSTSKGISNGAPTEEGPGEKTNAVAHGGPHTANTKPSNASGVPRNHPAIFKICRYAGIFDFACVWFASTGSIDSIFAPAIFLIFFRLFFT